MGNGHNREFDVYWSSDINKYNKKLMDSDKFLKVGH